MGKPTGFLEYERQENEAIQPLSRITNFNEFQPFLANIVDSYSEFDVFMAEIVEYMNMLRKKQCNRKL